MAPDSLINPVESLTLTQIATRLVLATLLGACVGFNADRTRRPAGMRLYATAGLLGAVITLILLGGAGSQSFLALAAAMLSCSFIIGLICLGLILQQASYARPTPGLTASASLALVAVLGIAAGRGLWAPFLIVSALSLLVLKGGGFLKDRSRRLDNPR